ncbi:uncharacterized protein LOC134276579 isoform X1 [Saccostrea cucullata]|uniref:uncharacterized protein LOC134276579 isoform X1 n=1 Tax=Saccostrea cuccullata TaxID=36930 RepID=UPI002ED5D60B
MSLSKRTSTPETANTARLARLILGPCSDVLRDILKKKIPPSELPKVMKQWSHSYLKNKKGIPFTAVNASQQQIVFPVQLNQYKGDYSDLGIPLLYHILRIVRKIPLPPKGWGKIPDPNDTSVAANIERISLLRNKYSANSKDLSLSDSEFNRKWENILKIIIELEQHIGSSTVYKDSVTEIKSCFIEPEDAQKYIERLGAVDELRTRVYKVSVSIGSPKKKNDSNNGSSSKVIHSDALSQILKRSLQQIYLEKLEESLQKTTINVEHSRGVLVGCAEAGKTTLLKLLMGETQDAVEDIESTRGLELHQHVFTIRNACLEVLSVNQKLGDHVSSEENNQQGSIFSTWTYKDYVKFWISSIKTFGSRNGPCVNYSYSHGRKI